MTCLISLNGRGGAIGFNYGYGSVALTVHSIALQNLVESKVTLSFVLHAAALNCFTLIFFHVRHRGRGRFACTRGYRLSGRRLFRSGWSCRLTGRCTVGQGAHGLAQHAKMFGEFRKADVALLGAASILCIVFGIPLGIWFARSKTAFAAAQPVLDFMQTMPAFVYLIPVIAFFGTGKPPGIIATLIFGMPPVIRLTTLGLNGVPEDIKEAARAFGATEWQVLRGVELPLAMPSILAGINQTILMCLSMVVIASLIGAQGLGSVVLQSLQYAAKGQGLLAGLAILLCAMVIDRIVQGSFRGRR
jgi:ABC-type proline/glycine betaine transport system permease subunit